MIKPWLKWLLIALGVASITTLIGILGYSLRQNTPVTQDVGVAFPDSQWVTVKKFDGYQTKADPSKVSDGANPQGQNTLINDGDRISVRDFGYEVLGTASTTEKEIKSLHTFRKRSGENILMRTFDTYVEYFQEGSDTWEAIVTTSTANQVYGFADYNINTDLRSYVYFGNGVDNFSRWTGAHTTTTVALAGAEASIAVNDTTDFASTGALFYCGQRIAYTAKTQTTFTVASAHACPINRGVAQAPDENNSNPKGNIYLVNNNRIFIAGVTSTPQAVYFSKYGDAMTYLTTLITDSTADAAGIFNLGEGGGEVIGMVQDEGATYILKKAIIYRVTLSDSLYSLEPLKPFDGKSQTTGGSNRDLIFSGGNGIFFVTPERQIMNLSRISGVDYPQIVPISDSIRPTTDEAVYTSGNGIFWQDRAYFAVKTNSDSAKNDVVFIHNTRLGAWESPIVGWPVSTFTIYDDGNGSALYFGDNNTANVYKVTSGSNLDNAFAITANWRSKQFDFGTPEMLKEIDNVYIDGYISNGTSLDITLMLDEDGFTQSFTTTLTGTEDDYIFDATPYNTMGLSPFGYLRFGTNDELGNKKFRIYLNKDFRVLPFYNAQLEFASDGENQEWEITNFGFKVRPSSQPERRTLYRSFK